MFKCVSGWEEPGVNLQHVASDGKDEVFDFSGVLGVYVLWTTLYNV